MTNTCCWNLSLHCQELLSDGDRRAHEVLAWTELQELQANPNETSGAAAPQWIAENASLGFEAAFPSYSIERYLAGGFGSQRWS